MEPNNIKYRQPFKVDLSQTQCSKPCIENDCYCKKRESIAPLKSKEHQVADKMIKILVDMGYTPNEMLEVLSLAKKRYQELIKQDELLHADSNDYRERYDNVND